MILKTLKLVFVALATSIVYTSCINTQKEQKSIGDKIVELFTK